MLNKIITLLFLALISFTSVAKDSSASGLSKTFHESGKINVVIAVIAVIFIGLVIFLIRTNLKLKKLEDQIGNK